MTVAYFTPRAWVKRVCCVSKISSNCGCQSKEIGVGMEVRLLSVGTRGFFLVASRLAIAAQFCRPNEKKTSGTRVVRRLQCFCFVFGRTYSFQKKSPPLPGAKHFPTWLRRDRWLVYFVVTNWQFLLQTRSSDSIEQYNEPPRYRLHRNFAKSLFVVQIYQTDARYGGFRLTNFAERHWRNDWRETLFVSQDIISGLRWTYICCIVL